MFLCFAREEVMIPVINYENKLCEKKQINELTRKPRRREEAATYTHMLNRGKLASLHYHFPTSPALTKGSEFYNKIKIFGNKYQFRKRLMDSRIMTCGELGERNNLLDQADGIGFYSTMDLSSLFN